MLHRHGGSERQPAFRRAPDLRRHFATHRLAYNIIIFAALGILFFVQGIFVPFMDQIDDVEHAGHDALVPRTRLMRLRQAVDGYFIFAEQDSAVAKQRVIGIEQPRADIGRLRQTPHHQAREQGRQHIAIIIVDNDSTFGHSTRDNTRLQQQRVQFRLDNAILISSKVKQTADKDGERHHIDGEYPQYDGRQLRSYTFLIRRTPKPPRIRAVVIVRGFVEFGHA